MSDNDFKKFIKSEDDIISNAASILEDARRMLDSGEITPSEFEEISNDVLELEHVDNLADNVDEKIRLQKSLSSLRAIVTLILRK